MLARKDTQILARYLVEDQTKGEIRFNERAELQLTGILNRLSTLLGPFSVFEDETKEQAVAGSLVEKLDGKLGDFVSVLKAADNGDGTLTYSAAAEKVLAGVRPELTTQERDLLLLTMFRNSRDAAKLPYEPVIKLLKGLGCREKSEAVAAKSAEVPVSAPAPRRRSRRRSRRRKPRLSNRRHKRRRRSTMTIISMPRTTRLPIRPPPRIRLRPRPMSTVLMPRMITTRKNRRRRRTRTSRTSTRNR